MSSKVAFSNKHGLLYNKDDNVIYKNIFYPESKYGGFTDVDSSIAFYLRVNALLTKDATLLDIGCGRGQYAEDPIDIRKNLQIFNDKCHKVIGIDVDEGASENPHINEFHLIDPAKPWPLDDESVDICINDWVLEHIEDPDLFFSECQRVLKPGGYLCSRTSNLLHYRSFFAMLIPDKYHDAIIRIAQRGTWRKDNDVFPTVYRSNTKRKMKKLLSKHGFVNSVVYGYQAEPAYLSFSRLTYALGTLYERFSPKLFGIMLFAFATKED